AALVEGCSDERKGEDGGGDGNREDGVWCLGVLDGVGAHLFVFRPTEEGGESGGVRDFLVGEQRGEREMRHDFAAVVSGS
ncbi:hypothetical protein HAX54_003176, partial [Datura stramonium]|nr:hypothetical protein [Datura stramonium]